MRVRRLMPARNVTGTESESGHGMEPLEHVSGQRATGPSRMSRRAGSWPVVIRPRLRGYLAGVRIQGIDRSEDDMDGS